MLLEIWKGLKIFLEDEESNLVSTYENLRWLSKVIKKTRENYTRTIHYPVPWHPNDLLSVLKIGRGGLDSRRNRMCVWHSLSVFVEAIFLHNDI